jgi:hypothetical protein
MTGATAELAAEGECKWTWATYPSKEQQKRAEKAQAQTAAGASRGERRARLGEVVSGGQRASPEEVPAAASPVEVPASPAVLAPCQPEECEVVTPPLKKRAFPVMCTVLCGVHVFVCVYVCMHLR